MSYKIPPNTFIVFDCFRTLISPPPENAYNLMFDELLVPSEEFMKFIKTTRHAINSLPEGWLKDESKLPELKAKIQAQMSKDLLTMKPYATTAEAIKYAGNQYAVYTNISEGYHVAPLSAGFKNVELSYEVGYVKPSVKVFEYLTEKYNLKQYAHVILVDDKPANIKAARAFGWKGALACDGVVLDHIIGMLQ